MKKKTAVKKMVTAVMILWIAAAAADDKTQYMPQKIKAGYVYSGSGSMENFKHYKILSKAKFNYAMVKFFLSPESPETDKESLTLIQQFQEAGEENGIHFVAVLNWAADHEVSFLRKKTTRCYVTETGTVLKKTPCFLDEEYWKCVIYDRFTAIAKLGVKDIMFDPEMYGADKTSYGDLCMCSECLADFEKAFGIDIPDNPANGAGNWLRENDLITAYTSFQEQRLINITGKIRSKLHKNFPDLTIGFLNYIPGAKFYQALAKGLGTKEKPCLIWTEHPTYKSGYTKYVDNLSAALAPNARLVCGLAIGKFSPAQLGAHAYYVAAHSSGYWLFTTKSFVTSRDKLTGDYRIPAPAEEYLTALKEANEELQKLDADPAYVTHLKLGKPLPATASLISKKLNIPNLQPLTDKISTAIPSFPPTFLRTQHTMFFYLKDGQETEIEIFCKQLVPHYVSRVRWKLVNNQNEVLKQGICDLNQFKTVEFVAPAEGIYALIGNAKTNIFSVRAKGCAQVYEVKPTLHLYKRAAPELYFFVPKEVQEFSVWLATGSDIKTFKCDVVSPNGGIIKSVSGAFKIWKELKIKTPEGLDGQVWRLRIGKSEKGRFDDAHFRFSSNIPPYVAEQKSWLLVP